MKALGGPAKVKEWVDATDFSHLPERKGYSQGGLVKKAAGLQPHEPPHEPSEGGVNNGHGIFAVGGPALREGNDKKFYKSKDRNDFGRFLSTEDRFTGGRKPAGFPQEAKTEEDWSKPKGVGKTEGDDAGDCKSLKPILPRT